MENTVEQKLKALFDLQKIDSKIDTIRTLRGELPMEVKDLEDEIAGLQTRLEKYNDEIASIKQAIQEKKSVIKESNTSKTKYETQIMNVKNSREYDALSKEIEMQTLEVQLAEKKIKEYTLTLEMRTQDLANLNVELEGRLKDLETKKGELQGIVAETEKEENELLKVSEEAAAKIEERLLVAYRRVRRNARNGLAVVPVERGSCGGCFNAIPPQRQMDIRSRKKILVCEHCGRILVDSEIENR